MTCRPSHQPTWEVRPSLDKMDSIPLTAFVPHLLGMLLCFGLVFLFSGL